MEIDAPARGSLADRYERVRTLGEGAFGVVYEALDRLSGARVALKELTRVSPVTLANFKQEFRAVQELDHPNLVRLEALFEDAGKWVIAMELVDGVDLLTHLYTDRDGVCFEEPKLREVFRQLALALETLHDAGFVHRDLKPANVLVTPQGRVVLLDFGLAVTVDLRRQSSSAHGIGTVSYMAPEQAAGEQLGPEADWYAFGVCLYQAMTGVLPIDADSPLALIAAKRTTIPKPASTQADGVPEDLDALCNALLERDPERRPESRVVRRMLSGGAGASRRPSQGISFASRHLSTGVFEGRERELNQLVLAYEDAKAGRQHVVLIEGESGIGKSSLVECFVALSPEAIVLRSRCYENELLAYKAFDGAMDNLAQLLSALPSAECEALMPPAAALLCRLFPSFASVQAAARGPLTGFAPDPSLQRLEAFAAFARLLANLSERSPVIFAIDDLQWADVESFRMLQAWLDAQIGRCLVLATVRPRAELSPEVAAGIDVLRRRGLVTELPLTGLPEQSARVLARELLGSLVPEAWVQTVVRESAGHPLFLTVLARYAESYDPSAASELTLDAAIAARLSGLSPDANRLLSTVALVGVPMSATLCGRAADLSEAMLGRLVTELCQKKLLRRRGAGEIACFHDRIRSVAVASLPRGQTRAMHGRIAAALVAQTGIVDRAHIARHHEEAGELSLAHVAYAQAAEHALSVLAFARAAQLYARALDLSDKLELAPANRLGLQTSRAHALARAGRSAEAARQYLEAAQHAQGEEQTRLRIWAAQHLLQSAHIDEGMAAARALLAELGVPLPRSTAGGMLRIGLDRTYLGLRGLDVGSTPTSIDARDRMRLDALWGLTMPVGWLDPIAASALSVRHLRLARALGEPAHMARALAEEAFARQLRKRADDGAVDELFTRARLLSGARAEPSVEVHLAFREGTVAMWRWQLLRACERHEHAHRVCVERCPDQPWLLTNVRVALGSAWSAVGEHGRLAASTAAWLAEARDRDDQFATCQITSIGAGYLRHLMADDPDALRSELDEAMRPWPREPFSFAHWGELTAILQCELYRGGDAAHLWLEHESPRFANAMLLKVEFGRNSHRMHRCLAAIAARNHATPERADTLLAEARSHLAAISPKFSPFAAIMALSIRCQLAALAGDSQVAQRLARETITAADAHGHRFVSYSVAYLLGLLEGDPDGGPERKRALEFFERQGWQRPRRAVCIMCPAIDELEARIHQ